MFLSHCIFNNHGYGDIRGEAYADQKSCTKCHKDIYQSYLQTGHYHTSTPITDNKLQNDIRPDTNVFIYNDSLQIRIEKLKTGLYQTAYFKNKLKVRQERFDIAFGSAERAQSYGYWKGESLYELPLSYFSDIHNWAISPGFPANLVYYNRAIVTRCLECHASFAESHYIKGKSALTVSEAFNKNSIVYGIDCQRCHGPAAEHVNYHLDNPEDKHARFIKTYQSLTRQGKVEMCAVCHSGNDQKIERSTFLYKPGDTLSRFIEPDFGGEIHEPDVHGNQAKLLARSKCYASNVTMTCTTCHNSHTKESNNLNAYNAKCFTCHNIETHNFCKMAPQLGNTINTKCIDCHMPAISSKIISYKIAGATKASSYQLHTHQIAVYPQKTQEILQMIKKIQ
ncbi:multiheme c-type cytochrome [Mucilaginibacter arboris]|uniref:Cytochrome c-552/4 domain-containing protein n=1 Tax=Mucilaginibacter arboris TaxID=2682090 RepID=A0A7K1SZR0_9SPHI|nr:multiheme c-type cytochrome [Mucilaginibacter arboris]MVN22802.1 hypothetical protein [Mucilaginibacter arboris]